jgi:3-oxocholest-4-en-26-oyl-CoA dehydrogenase beta subunit
MEGDVLGYDPALWKEMATLGWQGAMIPTELGGAGLGFIEVVILAEEIGRSLCPGPLLSTLIGSIAVVDAGSLEQQKRWLPSIAAGDAIWTIAFVEPAGSWDLSDLRLRTSDLDDGVRLDGTKTFVQDAQVADWILVVATSNGRPVAVAVERDRSGVEIQDLQTIGADRQAQIHFHGVSVPADHVIGASGPAGWIEELAQKASIIESAYLAGLCRMDLDLTVRHAASRVQFGQPIGAFQAIQHACANMLIDVDGADLTTYRAAWSVATRQPDMAMSASIAKAWTSDASSRVVSMCQQVSGAMGFTWDYDAQLYFRRQKRAELFWGDADFHREKVVTLLEKGR